MFRNTDFSNKTLHLVNINGDEVDNYPVHEIVWAIKSKYFEALFKRWNTLKQYTFQLTENESEIAFDNIIKSFYTNNLDTINPDLLFNIAMIADRMEYNLSSIICQQLRKNSDEDIPLTELYKFHNATVSISTNACYMQTVNMFIFRKLQNMNDILSNQQLHVDFIELPLKALIYLLNQDKLISINEDLILILVYKWVCNQETKSIDHHDYTEVLASVRFVNMSPLFLSNVVPNLKWINMSSHDVQMILEVQKFKELQGETPLMYSTNSSIFGSWFEKKREYEIPIKNVFFIDVDMQLLYRWISSDRSTFFKFPFSVQKGCVIYTMCLEMSNSAVWLKVKTPVIYGMDCHILHTIQGVLSFRCTINGLMTISTKNSFVALNDTCCNFPSILDGININALTQSDKISLYLKLN